MSRKGLEEVSVEAILKLYNLIVPEIQREYVWGFNEHNIIDVFIQDIIDGEAHKKNGQDLQIEELKKMLALKSASNDIKNTLEILIQKMNEESSELNIGFLYSYSPGYTSASKDRDLYLIDGQQRFTTLFLILFYLSIKEDKVNEFKHLFNVDINKGKLGFDYRVRSLTHQFFIDLIDKTKTIEDILSISQKTWFLESYSLDVTVKAIVGEKGNGIFQIFHKKFEKLDNKYFNYIKSNVKFWHFKTEETSQGEELYITMNSRGQQLADNESLRAKLFDSDIIRENHFHWSEQWEIWQDFFWKNRNKENIHSADEGFNEFLRWTLILNLMKKQSVNESDKVKEQILRLQITNDIKYFSDNFELPDIQNYFKALEFIYTEFKIFIKNEISHLYPMYSKREDSYKIKNYIDGVFLSQIELFRFLPILEYCKKHIEKDNQIDKIALYRFAKFVDNLSEDITVSKTVRDQISNIIKLTNRIDFGEDIIDLLHKENVSKTFLNEEQTLKLSIYEKYYENRYAIEDAFWYCEKLKHNRREIKHLIELNAEINTDFKVDDFKRIIKSYQIFLEREVDFWGNLLATDVYYEDSYRILRYYDFKAKKGLLYIIKSIYLCSYKNFDLLIENIQKDWIRNNYFSIEDLKAEKNRKKQLYILYIIATNNFNKKFIWNWNGEFNIGVFEENYDGLKSIFDKPYIYQIFNNSFRTNPNKILNIHSIKIKSTIMIEKLLEWSKN